MQIRHRIPTIFTLYMVDVLCCALGCVILLWQVNYREATDQTAAVKKVKDEMAELERKSGGKINNLEGSLQAAQLSLKAGEERAVVSAKKIEEMLLTLKASKNREVEANTQIKSLDDLINSMKADLVAAAKREGLLQVSLKTNEAVSAKRIEE